MLSQDLQRDQIEGAFMGRSEDHRRRHPIVMSPQPIHRGHTPSIAGHQAREVVLRHRRTEVIADAVLMIEELRGHHGTNGVTAEVLRTGGAGPVTIKAGEWIDAAGLQVAAQDVSITHRPQYRVFASALDPYLVSTTLRAPVSLARPKTS